MAITPNGSTVYVANKKAGTVTPINTATNTAGQPIQTYGYHGLPSDPSAIAITPDGKTAYVIGTGSFEVEVTPISVATNTAGPPIVTGGDTQALAITPDGKTVYVVDNASSYDPSDSAVVPISTATNTAGTPIPVQAALKPSGSQPPDAATCDDRYGSPGPARP